MKNFMFRYITTYAFVLLAGLSAFAQQIGPIPQGNNPKVEYKLVKNASGCYEVYFKSSVAFDNQLIQSAQVTIVSEKNTISQTNLPNGNVIPNGITFAATNLGNVYEIQEPGVALAATNDYLVFGINPFTVTTAANTDYLLFSFCLTPADCPGVLRLLQGVSPFSPFLNASNGCTACTYYTGATDPSQQFLDPYNNMSVDNNVQSGSGIFPNTLEAYQDNYGDFSIPCQVDVPDLTSSISPPNTTGTVGVPQNYTVTITNSGTGTSTGDISTTVQIPAGTTVNSAGGNGWSCSPSAPFVGQATLSCINTAPNLTAGSNSSFPLQVTPQSSGSFNFPTTVSGGGETVTTNNNSNALLTVGGNCNISAGTISINVN